MCITRHLSKMSSSSASGWGATTRSASASHRIAGSAQMDANGLPGQLGCEYVFNRFTSRFSFYAAKQEVCVLPDLSCSRRSSLRMKLSQQCLILRHVLAKVLSLLEKRRLRARDGTPLRRAWSEQSLRCCEEVRWTVVGSQRRRLSVSQSSLRVLLGSAVVARASSSGPAGKA